MSKTYIIDTSAGVLTADSMDGPWVKSPQNPIIQENEEYERSGHNHCFRALTARTT
ncbi:MAG: hypothetical protein J6S41_07280 [Clostridia bacterium]|nr:hypothetical protein [Clostridia bacterium]MBO5671336.1 hypothetical protein [Clostridia bacterium]